MRIESIRIRNYRVFQDVEVEAIPNMAIFLGMNGVGKTTFFDVFGFLHDALKLNFGHLWMNLSLRISCPYVFWKTKNPQ